MACGTITIGGSLSSGTYNTSYSSTLTASGGTGPYTYFVVFGVLPTGMTLNPDSGVVSGTPTQYGSFSLIIRAYDSSNESVPCFGQSDYTLTIANSTPAAPESALYPPVPVPGTANQDDQYNRLQHFMCCVGSKGAALATKLKISSDCCCDINTFELLTMYWSVLECYNPENTGNCLTQTEVNAIWDDVSKKCGICFSPYGSDYVNALNCYRITQNGNRRITQGGDNRIVDCELIGISYTDGIGYMNIGTTFIIR